MNRAYTSLSYGGKYATDWGDGQHHPEDYSVENNGGAPIIDGCLASPNCKFVPFLNLRKTQ
jgi:hypothetical protein